MLKEIPSYVYKILHRDIDNSSTEQEWEVGIEYSYVNKIENGRVKLFDNYERSLIRSYHLDYQECKRKILNEKLIDDCLVNIKNATMTKEVYEQLVLMREAHPHNYYVFYLVLVLYCYKCAEQIYDEQFFIDQKDLNKLSHILPEKYQFAFYVYTANYAIRIKDEAKYLNYSKLHEKMDFDGYQATITYNALMYIIFKNEYHLFPGALQECKEALKKEPNKKIENALTLMQGNYYRNLHSYDLSIEYYTRYSGLCIASNDMKGYGLAQNIIGWQYSLLKNYSKAIEHYILAEPYMNYADFYFDLAWCCFNENRIDEAKQYIKKGKNAYLDHKRWMLYLEWLECMINTPYSRRGYKKLLKLYKEYYEEQSLAMKNFLLTALANQYHHDGEIESENQCLKQLIELNVVNNHPLINE